MKLNTEIHPSQLDAADPLAPFRDRFHIPMHQGSEAVYLCGNSLGLQPKTALKYFEEEVKKWKELAVEGHFQGERPWVSYHKLGKTALAHLTGAKESEVVIMNNLTSNLHLGMASFYRPMGKRKKIIIEKGAFPSDHFAVTTHMQVRGVDPAKDLIEIAIPTSGYLSTEEIVEKIAQAGEELALVLFPGVQYYTGQFFDIKAISAATHLVGAYCGIDLAHAIGNVPLQLHDDQVDFATWCSYKYLNSGPGNVSGLFVHQKHGDNPATPRMGGWWGQDEAIRFKMENNFQPMPGVDGWMLSNVNILGTSVHLASLDIFEEAGIEKIRAKSRKLTGYLEQLIGSNIDLNQIVTILTPEKPEERGAQLSLYFSERGREVFEKLQASGIVVDWREPNVIRVAPAPLYNSFTDVYRFVEGIQKSIRKNVE